ncbi:MAG: ClpXP protease specificity-enhancing factor SspB [Aestuariivita sp.]|nr:ClpXP protease specificity-enhancing factor SspB [Aestuariivita sp.]MCY4201109.1 ClpXP protease specificity-enhancing factor SspB [Aestuariivita sp.]MCY4288296.1 ClpXP protease specificity-enhancing factor SspB [Aestuariivita sp.]MCY4345940.1 ClpXP protease specificity-enhancing factor SspB [Aestuariivita sp.]
MTIEIDYAELLRGALQTSIRKLLKDVEKNGLPGQHHFFITFDTRHPSVKMSDRLRNRYAGEMTVVLQNWYEDLVVKNKFFSVILNFDDKPSRITVPFEAIVTFVDPFAEIGLRFYAEENKPSTYGLELKSSDNKAAEEKKSPESLGKVLSLEEFRK